jgi:hypothetical protein
MNLILKITFLMYPIDFKINCNYLYYTNDRTIKEYLFYTENDKLNVLEVHEFNNNNVKTYINKKILYLNYQTYYENEITMCFNKYKDILLKTKEYIDDHDDFIKSVSSVLGPVTFQHRLKYGWVKNKNLNISLFKFKPVKCYVKENDNERILSKEEFMEFLKNFDVDIYTLNSKMKEITLNSEMNDITSENKKRKIESTDDSSSNKYFKTNTDFLFIKYPKHTRIEYQTCKTYNKEEMEFERQIHKISKLNINEC